MDNEQIRIAAIEFAKRNKNRIAKEATDTMLFKPDVMPVSVFMAGSPGAGKTEFSKSFISMFSNDVVRIDPDDIRPLLPGYTGNNSYLFQGAASLVVEKIHDLALKKKQNFIFDGTLSKYEKAKENIDRSIKSGRPVFVFYLYQKPEIAWKFTELREKAEGRNIPKEKFKEQFISAKETVMCIREEYDEDLKIFLVKNDFEKKSAEFIVEIKPGGKKVDEYLIN